ncbi:DUF4255 domain-containing protein [Xanthomonas campestris pv. phormiicola]|nr:DUF4255 domain-containing protein [Xanthomonas campestris pv. phormiicola]UYC18444.1 DUF4255 domain-containing protein [Xanthomonas campestris pv. phormiicola]
MPDLTDSGLILRSVSEALRGLIRRNVTELQAESAVVFDSPGEIESHDETKLSLYLYQTEVNAYMRNLPARITRQAAAAPAPAALETIAAPLVVDLTYLLVPYARSAELELVLVDKLMQLFHDVGQLSGEWLTPTLKRTGNEQIQIIPEFDSSERLRNIWSGFPHRSYKLTKLYTLSPVRIPSRFATRSELVVQADADYRVGP